MNASQGWLVPRPYLGPLYNKCCNLLTLCTQCNLSYWYMIRSYLSNITLNIKHKNFRDNKVHCALQLKLKLSLIIIIFVC